MSVFSEEEKIQILADIIEMNTENDNEIEVCFYLQKLLKKYDIDSEIIKFNDKRANLIAEIGSGSPKLGISGHMDVVDSGDKSAWTYNPFKLTEHDGKLYGRGTTDMKAGLVALVLAMIEVKEAGVLKQGTIRLLATAAEEKEMFGAERLYELGYVNDLDGLIIAEPTDDFVIYATKGSMGLKVTSKGVAAHSSLPALGHNAIDSLVPFIQAIKEKYNKIKEQDTEHSIDVSPLIKAYFGNDVKSDNKEDEAAGLVVVNSIIRGGEQFNTVPEIASTEYNIRTVPEYDNHFIKQLFEETINEIDSEHLKLEVTVDHPSVYTKNDNDLIKTITNYDNRFDVSGLVGATDAAEMLIDKDENFDLAIIGPGLMGMAHKTDEYVHKSRYLDFIEMYQKVFVNYLAEK